MALLAEGHRLDKVPPSLDGCRIVRGGDRRHLDVVGLVDSRAANEIEDRQDDDYQANEPAQDDPRPTSQPS